MSRPSLRANFYCVLLVAATVLAGCAKKPAMTQASAPPPLAPVTAPSGATSLGTGDWSSRGSGADSSGMAMSGQGGTSRGATEASGGARDSSGKAGASSAQGASGATTSGARAQGSDTASASQSGSGDVTHQAAAGGQGAGGTAQGAGQGDGSTAGQTAAQGTGVGAAGTTSATGQAQAGTEQGSPAGLSATTVAGAAAEGAGQGGSQPGGAGQMVASATRYQPNEFVPIPELRDVYFELDRYDVRPEDARLLDANADWLKTHVTHLLLIEGHCDERGTNEHNIALGEHRAKSAMNYLISQGVDSSRITIISYGEERPGCTDKSEGCWAKNRRAHFLVKAR